METATWIIAGASALNMLVLCTYAWFTWGIWRETRQTALRTEDLARQSRDAFRMQILAVYQEETRQFLQPAKGSAFTRELRSARTDALTQLIRDAFPDQWPDIEQIMVSIGERIVEFHEGQKQSDGAS